jgi:hypothetical protein
VASRPAISCLIADCFTSTLGWTGSTSVAISILSTSEVVDTLMKVVQVARARPRHANVHLQRRVRERC